MYIHSTKEDRGRRFWLHFKGWRHRVIALELYWWAFSRCGVSVTSDSEGWDFSVCLPPIGIYLSLQLGLWQPKRKIVCTWDHNRESWVPDERVCELYISDWTVRFTPWGRLMEWAAKDPWWIRGVRVNIKDLVLGRRKCTVDVLVENIPCSVPMPEGTYAAVAKIERFTRSRARWFTDVEVCAWLDIPKGIPHAGKGENSWDCGDDGLYGIGGTTVADAIARAQASVERSRHRHGHASSKAVREALA